MAVPGLLYICFHVLADFKQRASTRRLTLALKVPAITLEITNVAIQNVIKTTLLQKHWHWMENSTEKKSIVNFERKVW